MVPRVLAILLSESFVASFGYIATPAALRRALQRSGLVRDIRNALTAEEITERTIRGFTADLLHELRVGEPFIHDFALAAIAVAIENRGTSFANEFLRDLAQLELTEMKMSIRVARECLRHRANLAKTAATRRTIGVGPAPATLSYEDLALRYPREDAMERREQFVCGAQ